MGKICKGTLILKASVSFRAYIFKIPTADKDTNLNACPFKIV